MKDLKIVIDFTIKDMIKRKSFIISTLIILILIVIGFNVPNIINAIKGEEVTNEKLLIVDESNIFEGTLENIKTLNLGYDIEISNEKFTFDDIKNKIENEEIETAILIEPKEEKIEIKIYS